MKFFVAFGYGLGLAALLGVQTEYFDRYKNFATAFIYIGSPAGTFAFATAFVYFVNLYSALGSMLINACFSAQIILLGALLRSRTRLEYHPLAKLFDFSLLRNPLQIFACFQMALL